MLLKPLCLSALMLCFAAAHASSNVALNGVVTLTGSDFGVNPSYWGTGSLAAASTPTDGLTLPLYTQWNDGTVFWTGEFGADTITVSLATAAIVSHIDLQADNNDDYAVAYRDLDGTWHSLVTISPTRSAGMDYGSADFAPVTATAFAITAVGGDTFYAVSEFQAIGSPVPEPTSAAMILTGLLGVGALARRRMTAGR